MINFDIKSKVAAFGQEHTHQTNIWLHLLAIPLGITGLLGVFYAFKFPIFLREDIQLNLAHIIAFIWFLYYFISNKVWALGMVIIIIFAFWVQYNFEENGFQLFAINGLIIFIAGILMFWGHKKQENITALKDDLFKIIYSPAWFIQYLLHLIDTEK